VKAIVDVSGHVMQAHFTNLQVVSFHSGVGNRVDRNFDDRLIDMLSKKSTLLSKSRRELDISTDFESSPNKEYSTQEDETEIENCRDIDSQNNKEIPHPDFGRLKETKNVDDWQRNRSETEEEANNAINSIQSAFFNDSQMTNDTNITYEVLKNCPLCKLENASIDLNCPNIDQHPTVQEFIPKLVKKIRKDEKRMCKEIELAEMTKDQIRNDIIDIKSNASQTSQWLNDSYNLLFNNGRVRKITSNISCNQKIQKTTIKIESLFSLSSQNIDSFVKEGETTLNTDSLSHSTCSSSANAMDTSTCKEQQTRKSRDESQKSSITSLVNMSKEHTPPPQKRGEHHKTE